jgi:hypothetical protein
MITTLVKKVFNGKDNSHTGRLKAIQKLPQDRVEKELGRLLFDTCVEHALSFIKEEHSKADSLFRELHKHKLFHEMMAINFWLVDKKFTKTKKTLIDEVHNLYSLAYSESAESFNGPDSLKDRYKIYHDSWNDITGHQDQFGSRATEFIFGNANNVPVEQTSFWIISHAHESVKIFSDIKRSCRNLIV